MAGRFLKFRGHVVALYGLAYFYCARLILGAGHPSFFPLGICVMSFYGFVYLFNKACDTREDSVNAPSECLGPEERRAVLKLSLILYCLPLAYLIRLSRGPLLACYLVMGLVGACYSLPLGARKLRLKSFAATKALVPVCLAFGMLILLPLSARYHLGPAAAGLAFLRSLPLLMSVMAAEWLWDIRDAAGDESAGIRTLPVLIGARRTAALAALLMAGNLALGAALHLPMIAALSGLILAFALGCLRARTGFYYHALVIGECLLIGLALAAGPHP
ncbi:MAG: UbiA family prenyltransferase [Elusimicrobia bacterium]|nr:UbiA family prenyltransferase [Elusimicrobiota bacterium]